MALRKAADIAEMAFKMATDVFGLSKYRQYDAVEYDGDYRWNVGWWKDGYWHSDCLGFVHICVNGFYGDKSKVGGGAVMDDFVLRTGEAETLNGYCSVKGEFPKVDIKPATLLQNSGHVGLYIGEHEHNGVIYNSSECTLDGAKGWILTYTDINTGARYLDKGGAKLRSSWEKWGQFDMIDYTEEKPEVKQTFSDVPPDSVYYKAVEWAYSEGLYKGYADGTFRPEEPLTRGQDCIVRWREAGRPEPKKTEG